MDGWCHKVVNPVIRGEKRNKEIYKEESEAKNPWKLDTILKKEMAYKIQNTFIKPYQLKHWESAY